MTPPGAPHGPEQITVRGDFARCLTDLRHRQGLTVRDIAKATGIPPATIGGYFSGRHLPSPTQQQALAAVLAACGVTDQNSIAAWSDALRRVRAAVPKPAGQIPYRGLESFRPQDADWFFGRDELTDSLLELVRAALAPGGGGVVAVVGPSGSGKSSLIGAGLIPRITDGAFGSPSHCELITPGSDPTGQWHRIADAEGAVGCAQRVFVVDQFEEVFTSCDESQRRRFVTMLHAAWSATAPDGRHRTGVVLGIRADFYGELMREPELVTVLQDAQLLVGPLDGDGLRRAIVEPAQRAGLRVDDDLVELLVRDLEPHGRPASAHDPGALPLLSHSLLATWERATTGRLTVADYRAAGGIRQAVQQTAETLFTQLTAEEQALARRILLRLVNIDDESALTRRRVRRAELREDVAGADLVLDRFITARLLTANAGTVEVSHEALLTAWPRLHDWLETDRAGLRLHRQLTHAAIAWQDSDRDSGALLRGGRFVAVREWAADPVHAADLNRLEREFLAASEWSAASERRAGRRRTRRLTQLLVAVTVLAVLACGLAVVALRSSSSARSAQAMATRERDLALSRQVAIESVRLRDTDPALAMQLALAAYRISPTVDARSALLETTGAPTDSRLIGAPGPTQTAVSPDGSILAVAGADGTVRLWRLGRPGHAPARIGLISADAQGKQLYAVAFGPGGHLLVTAGQAGTVTMWNVADPTHAVEVGRPLTTAAAQINGLAVSPDGQQIAAASAGSQVYRWQLTDGDPRPLTPLAGFGGAVTALAFAPGGDVLAVSSDDGQVRLFRSSTAGSGPLSTMTIGATSDFVLSIAFSPDGRTLAAGAKDHKVSLWDVTDPAAPVASGELTGFTSWVNAVAFSSDGATIAAGSSDDTARLWNLATRRLEAILPVPAVLTSLAFQPDGRGLITAEVDGVTRIWSLPGPVLSRASDTIFTLGFSGDGTRLVTAPGAQDSAGLQLWDTSDPAAPAQLGAAGGGGTTLDGSGSISTDGRLVASGTSGGAVLIWNTTDPSKPVPVAAPLTGATSLIESTAFQPQGHLLAAGSDDFTVRLWDISKPSDVRALATLQAGNEALAVAFSPDGTLLAAATAGDIVRMWDVSDPAHPRLLGDLRGFTNYAYTLAFSPDGHLIAAGSTDKTVRLWDITQPTHPTPVGNPLTGPTDTVLSVAFSPDGHSLAAGSADDSIWLWSLAPAAAPTLLATLTGTKGNILALAFDPATGILASGGSEQSVRLWDTNPERVATTICERAGDPMTPAEWSQYIPGQGYHPPCSS